MAYFYARPTLATDLNTQLTPRSRQETDGGIFIPTSVKYFCVTAALWIGLATIAATFWVGAFSIGTAAARWMAR